MAKTASFQELAAYRSHAETFFGKYDPPSSRHMRDNLDLFDWFKKGDASLSRERLLVRLATHTDFEKLKTLSQEELLSIYCERLSCFCSENAPLCTQAQELGSAYGTRTRVPALRGR
jgi:hypothetical protein